MSNDNPSDKHAPVITIDGPAGVGKGTLAKHLAKKYSFHYLDSGAVYRALAAQALKQGVELDQVNSLVDLAGRLQLSFPSEKNFAAHLNNEAIDASIRTEECSQYASQIAVDSEIRQALLALQRGFQQLPGLVGDGRDLGTVVFPHADVKIFLDASCEERARRRYKQLIDQGISANFEHLFDSIQQRDERDRSRVTAPLKAAEDAWVIDSTDLTIEAVVENAAAYVYERLSIV